MHRDLKLGNLFLDKNLRVKVGDFGLATQISRENPLRTTMCGTPNYMAPEILNVEKRGGYGI
jgi:polo-like kinase 1